MIVLTVLFSILSQPAAAFNNPPGVETWCGKAYLPTNASFPPGGWLDEPAPSSEPLLDLRIRPRMNLYTADDQWGSFIVDAGLSFFHGQPYYNSTYDQGNNGYKPFDTLFIDIADADTGLALVSGANVSVNSTANEFTFSLAGLRPQFEPYNISITGASQDGNQSYVAQTQLYRLPSRTDGGSVTKLDSLYGGLLVQDSTAANSSASWTPLLPYSFYVIWDGYLNNSLENIQKFKDQGYNIVHVVPDGNLPNQAFNFTQFNQFLDICDEIGLWVMYDMRYTYLNLTSVEEQVNMIKARKSLLLWYTGDEPDGHGDPLNATRLAYDLIKSLDPWHPVSLCLNCYNFYYADYSSGADIVLSDVYPIAVNTTWSVQYHTVCNTTYGCCGCDDCKGDFEDISTRLDLFTQYQDWIGGPPKTLWGVPQAFGGGEFWARNPTPDEEVTMNLLSINHNAKGIVMWSYPTEPDLEDVTSSLSKVLAAPNVTSFLLGAPTTALKTAGADRIDAAGWQVGKQMLVSILYLEYIDSDSQVTISLPTPASSVTQVLWGTGWTVSGGNLVKNGLKGLEADLLIVGLE
ncbi:hypothetical protein VTN96DRAFT_9303 [Rasamsonia emersonii]|uniref:Glycoside hydrolase subgroup catalytic core protein n=1 Tax=Rasamsonia emersonii (strain ATCC 16479 / CBS 393.64 / IMI 116815) TaxID=1408163 RepID=A0A0F4Z191_RASE3|nr:hypothetical protein T310_1674 [Rasamsonia emersonii CBS 393.64]KKA24287.1 hypothetical protein T310_1674 [Rasamsonia emersonii CBS 393.64]